MRVFFKKKTWLYLVRYIESFSRRGKIHSRLDKMWGKHVPCSFVTLSWSDIVKTLLLMCVKKIIDTAIMRCSYISHLNKMLRKHLRRGSTLGTLQFLWLLLENSSSAFLFIIHIKTHKNSSGFSKNHLSKNTLFENATSFKKWKRELKVGILQIYDFQKQLSRGVL